jgi:hypothetical protein
MFNVFQNKKWRDAIDGFRVNNAYPLGPGVEDTIVQASSLFMAGDSMRSIFYPVYDELDPNIKSPLMRMARDII